MRYLFFVTVVLLFKSITVEATVDSLRYGDFGQVYIYKPSKVPDAFVLFVSGDGGWNKGIMNIGMHIVAQGAMVVGINIKHYEKNKKQSKLSCYYPAGDFESLSIYIQKKYKFSTYLKPVLMGYSSGATLVYGALVQAPENTFKGAISMGFCPDIVSTKPLCRGSGLELHPITPGVSWFLEPYNKLKNPFIVINGVKDKICNYKDTEAFVKKVPSGEFILIQDAAHGMSVKSNYMPHLLYAYKKVKESSISIPTDGPFVILPAEKGGNQPIVLFISGDGGWTSFDDGIAKELVKKGISVIGMDSQKYFWQQRTPKETALEIAKILEYYLTEWEKTTFVLVGYSFGADVVPFIIPILPENISKHLIKSILISPDISADFEIHISDLLHINPSREAYDVVEGVRNLRNDSIVCIFGSDEDTKRVLSFEKAGAIIKILPGKHHFNNDYNSLKNVIMFSLPKKIKMKQ
jgi:type IV secretory pathway VirJ component